MASARKRGADEIDRTNSDERDAQQVPDNNDELIVGAGSTKRRQPLSANDHESATAAAEDPTTTDREPASENYAPISAKDEQVPSVNKEEQQSAAVPDDQDNNNTESVDHNSASATPTTKENRTVEAVSLNEQVSVSTALATENEEQQRHVPPVPTRQPESAPTTSTHRDYQVVPAREPTIFNIRPVDDVALYIADIVGEHCKRQHVEIEAKLGTFVDKHTGQRINMGAVTETVLNGLEHRVRFEANMPQKQHHHFNKMLNALVTKSQARDYRRERIRYLHTKETDSFYPVGRDKWRVTTDQQTGQIVPNGIIEKQRVMNINIHVPKQPLDYRISINIEMPRPRPQGRPSFQRHKDRVSYKHGGIQFDLTQVKGGDYNDEVRHELELEIMDPLVLAREKSKADRREASQYTELVESFINNVRMLCRGALKMSNIV
ncbi:CYTH-like domain-containing protein [Zychaea mexicana]|uniref:CYTH-like domain-containing protein n=1 Tax=Zychaea mexicana TaxID=64656 RepID=UPI0022FDF64F|nr:CYTH-like domain-containing protein [Zychaea mexicana]KAI9491892.1 CYTH-like domain-containing protein [Zychaea mexicana]